MSASITLAMKMYSSWSDRLFSQDTVEDVLMLGMFVSAVIVMLLAWRRKFDGPYFSGAFALSLCPFLLASVVALLRIHSLIEVEDIDTPMYVVERLRFSRQVLVFGGAISIFSLTVYSAIYAANRRPRSHVAEGVPSNDRNP
jgi:hypothetical protein